MVTAVSSKLRPRLRPSRWAASLGKFLWRIVLRLTRPFRQLQFKLGLAYMATSVCMVVLGELIFAVVLGMLLYGTDLVQETWGNAAAQGGQELAWGGALTAHPGPEPVLDRQLALVCARMQNSLLSPSSGWPHGPGPIAAVVDTQGRVLACAPGAPFAVGKPLADQLPPEDTLWIKTVAGNLSEQRGFGRRNLDGSVIAVGPIRTWDSDKRLGLLVVRVNGTVTRDQFANSAAAIIAATIPVMLVFGGLTGLVFGRLAARPVTRRLRALSAATDAWGQGDFTARVPDRAGDEIGELGRHLAGMAEELRRHIRAQQKLASLEERNRLARDLHDTVKQQAFAAAMQLGAARTVLGGSTEPAAVFVAQAEALTNKMQEDLMAILHELRPAENDPPDAREEDRTNLTDLSNRLREEVLDWSQLSRIPADVRAANGLRAPDDVCQALLRIAQEALANVARHSRATRVQAELNQAEGVLELMVSDDGEGFDPLFTPRGMGLYSMRDRALSLPNGRFRLDTSPGAGVTVRVSCAGAEPETGERDE